MLRKILVPLDGSALAEQALARAASIARATHAAIDVAFVHAPLPFGGFGDTPWTESEWTAAHNYLETIAAELRSGAGVVATHGMLRGTPADLICARARDIGADLIVMTSHGRSGLSRVWLGSVTDAVVRHADMPVLVVPATDAPRPRLAVPRPFAHVVVPLDGSALALEILDAAADLAVASQARMSLVEVVRPVRMIVSQDPAIPLAYVPAIIDEALTERVEMDVRQRLDATADTLRRDGLTVDTDVVVSDHVAAAIIDYAHAHGADAIAMSTHGRGASRVLLGSIADKVTRGSGMPTLLRRPMPQSVPAISLTAAQVEEELPALSGL